MNTKEKFTIAGQSILVAFGIYGMIVAFSVLDMYLRGPF